MSIYEQGLGRAAVNHVALSPLSFIERTAAVYPHYPAVVHGSIRRNWAETYARCRRLASALRADGLKKGDRVAFLAVDAGRGGGAHGGLLPDSSGLAWVGNGEGWEPPCHRTRGIPTGR